MFLGGSAIAPESSAPGSSPVQYMEEIAHTLKRRKKKPMVNIYTKPIVPKSRQHTQYQINSDNGSITYTHKYVAPPENARRSTIPHHDCVQMIEDVPLLSIPEPFDDFPPGVSIDHDSEYPASRKRAAGVCSL
jgi:hypothetical protein